jgi:hypothetical protein
MRRISQEDIHYIELFLGAVLFATSDVFSFVFSFASDSLLFLNLAIAILFLAFALAFVLSRDDTGKRSAAVSAFLHLDFVAIAASYAASFALNYQLWRRLMESSLLFGVTFVALIPLFFFIFTGTHLMRDRKQKVLLIFLVVLLVLVIYYTSDIVTNSFKIDDEELLMFESTVSMFNGVNPYVASFSDVLYQNAMSIGFTLTTGNGIIGHMDYPALFIFTFIPFYFLSQPSIENLTRIDLPLQESAFIFILMVVVAFFLDKKELLRPRFSLLVFFVFVINYCDSITMLLMVALFIIAYMKVDSKYSWVFIGLAASIHQVLWLPLAFLIAYSFNNRGIRKGLENAIGAVAVFLVVGAYFIVDSPAAYFGAIFNTLNAYVFPSSFSSIGFAMTKIFPVLLPTYSQLFELVSLFLMFLLLYFNRKELIPIFSMVPFLMMNRSLNAYYETLLFLFFFALTVSKGKETGWVERLLKKRRYASCAIAATFLVMILALLMLSHTEYVRNFNITMSKPSLFLDAANASSVYTTTLSYSNLSNNTIYVVAVGIDRKSNTALIGYLNYSILDNSVKCDALECMDNLNRVILPRNRSQYALTARLRWYDNETPIYRVAMELYNGKHFYFGKVAQNESSWN